MAQTDPTVASTDTAQAQRGAQEALCRSEYVRPGGSEPGDRVVRCGRRKGHGGDHDEMIDGEAGNWWPQEPAPVTDPPGLDAAIEAAALATAQHHIDAATTDADGNMPCCCGGWWDAHGEADWDDHLADIAVRAAAPALRAGALREAADEIDHARGVYERVKEVGPTAKAVIEFLCERADRIGGAT